VVLILKNKIVNFLIASNSGQRRQNSQHRNAAANGRRGQAAIEANEIEEESKSPFSAFFGLGR
jgi:hypothetical protein